MFNEFGFDGNLGFETFNAFEDHASNPNPINWNAIIQQAFAVGSHAISAFSGQNTGTQVGYNTGQGGVFAIQPNVQNAGGGYSGAPVYTPEQLAMLSRNNGNGGIGEDAFASITEFVQKYPVQIGAGVLALYLLMREPPKRR